MSKLHLGRILFIIAGVLSASFGIEGFLIPAGFIDGGITGISMLSSKLLSIPLAPLLAFLNLPFLILGYMHLGTRFTLWSAAAITAFALSVGFFPFPHVVTDKLLAAVFGGIFLGAGVGLSIRGGGVLDGTEVLALLISRKIGTTVGDIVLVFNALIFSVAALSLGLEPALYSVLTYASAARSMDFLLHGLEEYYSLLIVTEKYEVIRDAIIMQLSRSVTRLAGHFGRGEHSQEILFSVLTRLELSQVRNLILEIDPRAFIVVHPVRDVSGGVVKARPIERLAGMH